jgi:hypothetical protein
VDECEDKKIKESCINGCVNTVGSYYCVKHGKNIMSDQAIEENENDDYEGEDDYGDEEDYETEDDYSDGDDYEQENDKNVIKGNSVDNNLQDAQTENKTLDSEKKSQDEDGGADNIPELQFEDNDEDDEYFNNNTIKNTTQDKSNGSNKENDKNNEEGSGQESCRSDK